MFLKWRDVYLNQTGLRLSDSRKTFFKNLVSVAFSTNSVLEELNQLTKTNLLKPQKNGRQVFYMANQEHPLLPPKLEGRPRVLIGEEEKGSRIGRIIPSVQE